MRDIRAGICPLCANQEVVEAVPAQFSGDGGMELSNGVAVTYDKRWLLNGRNPNYPHGLIRVWFCRRCGFMQSFVLAPETVPIGEDHRTTLHKGAGAGAAEGEHARRQLETSHATIYHSDVGVEQVWPNGAVHTIRWDRPFVCTMHRSLVQAYNGPTADVHVQLKQQGEERLDIVAFSLCLTDQPEIQRLDPLMAFLPRVEGPDAEVVLESIRRAAQLNGASIPL